METITAETKVPRYLTSIAIQGEKSPNSQVGKHRLICYTLRKSRHVLKEVLMQGRTYQAGRYLLVLTLRDRTL